MTPPLTLDGFGAHLTVHAFEVPLGIRFRGVTSRRGVLLSGPSGWGEWSPFDEYEDAYAARWLQSAVACARDPWPRPVRDRVPVNASIPAVAPEQAQELVRTFGSTTAKVKVAESGQSPGEDADRVAAVRDALGTGGKIRVDANAAWSVDEAVDRIAELDRAAGGLEYIEQPCRTLDELAEVRRRVDVPIAADESIRTAEDPLRVVAQEAADVLVLKVQPLGGPRRTLELIDACGLPVVLSSALETSIGLAAGIAVAAALDDLPYACGLGTAALLAADVTSRPLVPVDGTVPVERPSPIPALLASARPEVAVEEAIVTRLERVAAIAETTTYR